MSSVEDLIEVDILGILTLCKSCFHCFCYVEGRSCFNLPENYTIEHREEKQFSH